MATNVIVCGAAGRMGRCLVGLAHASAETTLRGAVERRGHATVGQDAGIVAGVGSLGIAIGDDLRAIAEPDCVIVDFTAPSPTLEHLRVAVATRAAAVIGTTGFTPKEEAEVRMLAARTRTLMSPNMSVGVNVLLGAVRQVARALGDAFDVEVVELHHHHKKDAPSGTALALARAVAEVLGRSFPEDAVFGRQGQIGERPPREIGVLAMRAGDATGDHTVLFGGTGERLELTHRSQSRECFAAGALRAAVWLAGQRDGLYSMADVLGLA
jgi:4-hydroxy-tetrahydrodipicolinate reductase